MDRRALTLELVETLRLAGGAHDADDLLRLAALVVVQGRADLLRGRCRKPRCVLRAARRALSSLEVR